MENQLIAGRYRLVRAIGRGGMGTVWLAHDEVLDRDVAVKQIGDLPGNGAEQAERARREARLAASLNHPNAVAIYDVTEHEHRPWLVMEYIAARNLSQIIADGGPLPPHAVAPLAAQIAKALAAAHATGIVHRDVKPSNILVDEFGIAKITDFGVAKANTDPQLTRTGMLAGTPAYFAPEVARGRAPAPPADVWSLGATIFHALEGHPPFGFNENTIELLYQIGLEQPAPAQHAGPLAEVLEHLLDVDPLRRWNMATAAAELEAIAADVDSQATDIHPVAGGYGVPSPAVPLPGAPGPGGYPPGTYPPASYPSAGYPPDGYAAPAGSPTGGFVAQSGPGTPAGGMPHIATQPPPADAGRGKRGKFLAIGAAVAVLLAAGGVGLTFALSDTSGPDSRADASTSAASDPAPGSDPSGGEESGSETPPTTSSAPTSEPAPTQSEPAPSSSSGASMSSATPDPAQVAEDLEATVADYYEMLPDDPGAAFNGYLTDSLASNYADYLDFWESVNWVTCTDYEGDPASLTVNMHCVYDTDTEITEQDQTATLVEYGDGYRLAAMSVSNDVHSSK